MSFLEGNLAVLGRRFPELAAELAVAAPASIELVTTRSGSPSARADGRLLHSAHDPVTEASRLLAASLPPWADGLLLLGVGLGYLVDAALARSGPGAVILGEADPGMLRAALESRNLRASLADERLGFVLGGNPERILGALEASGMARPAIVGNKAGEGQSPAWYAGFRAAVGRFLAKEETNENTLRKFGGLWARNLARNLSMVPACPGLAGLEGLFRGIPVLVLAAGPSLDEVLPYLPALRERLLLVAVDTSLRSVLGAGVEPDFLLVVDPQYWNWRHLAGLRASGTFLVTEPAVFPAVFRFPCRGFFVASSIFPLGRVLEAGEQPRGLLGAGGSVATSAWDLARLLGSMPIYLAGLDLGFPGGRTHARASLFEQRALASGRRLAPAATAETAARFGPGARPVPSEGGGTVLSDDRMALYAWWFESRLARPNSPPSLRLSSGGRSIPGLGCVEIAGLLDLPPRREAIEQGLEVASAIKTPEGAAGRVFRRLSLLRVDLESVRGTARDAVQAAELAHKALESGVDPDPSMKRLDAADRMLLGNKARDIAGFLLPPVREILGGKARDLGESLRQSEALYRGILEAAEMNLRNLELGDSPPDGSPDQGLSPVEAERKP